MNRKIIVNAITAAALSFIITPISLANIEVTQVDQQASKKVLMAKLATLNFFSANFSQEVLNATGEVLEQSSGTLALSKPNLANWQTITPNEIELISDGKNVWLYDPWVEQVSIYSLSGAIAQTPILLLTSQDENLWQQYSVTQQDNRFIVSAKNTNSQVKSLTLFFADNNDNSELSQFSFLDATGQTSNIKLHNYDAKKAPNAALFHFVIPEGVQIDDQRAK